MSAERVMCHRCGGAGTVEIVRPDASVSNEVTKMVEARILGMRAQVTELCAGGIATAISGHPIWWNKIERPEPLKQIERERKGAP